MSRTSEIVLEVVLVIAAIVVMAVFMMYSGPTPAPLPMPVEQEREQDQRHDNLMAEVRCLEKGGIPVAEASGTGMFTKRLRCAVELK